MPAGLTECPKGSTVLVVDDDAAQRNCLFELLVLAGYDVVVARDGLEALELLSAGLEPCLIVLDLAMPRMNGWVFLERLRGPEQSTVPVLVTSAEARARRPAGADAWVEKPIDLAKFGAVVQRLSGGAGGPAAASHGATRGDG